MSGETIINLIGNLTDDPELRFTSSGVAVAKFRIASTPRTFDKAKNEWVDGQALFLACQVWRQMAENVAESLTRGSRVILSGRLGQRTYETKEGEKRTVFEVDVDEIGPSLRHATAKVQKMSRSSSSGNQQAPRGGSDGDPWASQGADRSSGFGGKPQSGFDDSNPPF